jgi:hypothetical protein
MVLLKTAAAQQELRPTGGAPVDGAGRASLPASRIPDEERFFSGTNRYVTDPATAQMRAGT